MSASMRPRIHGSPANGRWVRAFSSVAVLAGWAALATGCSPALLRGQQPALERETPAAAAAPRTIAEVRQQAELDPGEPFWPYRLAQLHLEQGANADARVALAAALERDPLHWPTHSLLSKLDFEAARHQEAIERLEAARAHASTAAADFPEDLDAALALHYDALDHLDRADDAVKRLTRSDTNRMASAHVYLKLRSESLDGAARLAAEAVRRAPESSANQNNFGITKLRSGDPKTARRAFLRAIQLDPDLPGPYYNLAILEKFYAFDDEAAARWFAQYWQRSRDDPDGLLEIFAKDGGETARKD